MEKLSVLLNYRGEKFTSALKQLQGKNLAMSNFHNARFKIINIKEDYFIGELQESTADPSQNREFISKFDMEFIITLAEAPKVRVTR
jgi:hypothetical protein